jgi:pimeloyl-ACP methyl ester carboxylesterase
MSNNMKEQIQTGHVETEGDTLYFEVRGEGPPVLLIPPAGGDGDLFMAIADILSSEYKVITYDRRANARSTMNYPQNFEISQQSRDAAAIIRAAGKNKAFVFGNSSGGVIALDMAKTQPDVILAVIAHEPAIAHMHPDHKKWGRFFAGVYKSAFSMGPSWAAMRFIMGIRVPIRLLTKAHAQGDEYTKAHGIQCSEKRIGTKEGVEFLMKQELLPVTNYLPDAEKIKQNGVKVVMAAGSWALQKKTWYAETAQIMAEKLGCEFITFPGHHGSYMDMPEEFAKTLREILKKAQK